MAGNSPFPGWEILCLGNTAKYSSTGAKLSKSCWGCIFTRRGSGGETSLEKASTIVMVISATVEHLLNALHLQSGLQTLMNPPRAPTRQVLVSPFYRWSVLVIKC